MSNKLTISALLASVALAAGVWAQEVRAQDKPSPFNDSRAGDNRTSEADAAPLNTPAPANYNSAPAPYNSAPAGNSTPMIYNSAPATYNSAPATYNSAPATYNPAPATNAPVLNDGQARYSAPPPPPVANRPAASSPHDPFPDDVIAINQSDLIWRTAQNRLEELGSGCISSGDQIIDQARDAKLKSVASYAKYYQDTLTYWTKSRDASGEAEMSSRTDSAELQAHVNQLQLELQSVNRRKADLDRTFGENHVDSNDEKAALQDLTRIQVNKQEQLEKGRAALDQNKAGHEWVMKRKEYARVRLAETNDLLQSTRTELYLYQQLYNAILYRHNLSCDREVSRPLETLSDWRQDLKKLSPGSTE